MLLAAITTPLLCPQLVEVMTDPATILDRYGEYVEILFPARDKSQEDTLMVVIENQEYLRLPLGGTEEKRILICGDSTSLAFNISLPCVKPRRPLNLINQRPLQTVVKWGDCIDSTTIPSAVRGKSWRRAYQDSLWSLSQIEFVPREMGTPGWPDPGIEIIQNNLKPLVVTPQQPHPQLPPTDGTALRIGLATTGAQKNQGTWPVIMQGIFPPTPAETLMITPDSWQNWEIFHHNGWYLAEARTFGDDYPLDNRIFGLAFFAGNPPLGITEIMATPADDSPEWIEIRNFSQDTMAPHSFGICQGPAFPQSLAPGELVVFVQDSSHWSTTLDGSSPFWWQPPSWKVLRNGGDTIRLCLLGHTVDSLWWNRNLPRSWQGQALVRTRVGQGDLLLSGQPERSSPGFQIPADFDQDPCSVQLWSRIVQRNHPEAIALRLYSGSDTLRLELKNGRGKILRRHVQLPKQRQTLLWSTVNLAIPEPAILLLSVQCGRNKNWKSLVVAP